MTITLYDTTLRDGSQGEGIAFTVEDKLLITQKLDELGVHYIEAGWPGSNPKDLEYFDKVSSLNGANVELEGPGCTQDNLSRRRMQLRRKATSMNM